MQQFSLVGEKKLKKPCFWLFDFVTLQFYN